MLLEVWEATYVVSKRENYSVPYNSVSVGACHSVLSLQLYIYFIIFSQSMYASAKWLWIPSWLVTRSCYSAENNLQYTSDWVSTGGNKKRGPPLWVCRNICKVIVFVVCQKSKIEEATHQEMEDDSSSSSALMFKCPLQIQFLSPFRQPKSLARVSLQP